jgi:TonB family protein
MNDQLATGLKVSTATHAVALVLLLVCPVILTNMRKVNSAIPVEFTVAVPQVPPEPWVKPSPPAAAHSYSEADSAADEAPAARSRSRTARPQPAAQTVQRSHSRVTRYETVHSSRAQKPSTPLSQSEIQRLLAMGAKLSDTTSIPTSEERSFETIRRALYDVWSQPSAEEAGDAVVEVEIELGAGGAVAGWRIVRRSGVAAMDASVAAALKAVKRIGGLTPAFLARHDTVTIAFRLER